MKFLRARLQPILISGSILVALLGVVALSSRPSDVRRDSNAQVTTESDPENLTVGDAGTPTETVAGASPGTTGRSARRTAGRVGAVGSGAAPLVTGLGPGVSDTSIKIGLIVVSNNDKLLSGYGVKGGAIGDTQDQANAVVNDLNSRGGILGRKILPVFRTWDASPGSDTEAQFQSFCAAFTQDQKVFAVLTPWNTPVSFASCLAKAGTLYVVDGLDQEDLQTYGQLQPYMVTGMMSSSRGAVALARGLHQQGFFAAGTRLGIIRQATPTGERVSNQYFKPTLASLGVPPAIDEKTVSSSNAPNVSQSFKDQKIDRVAFITARGGPPLFFMNAANANTYKPIYGLASPDSPAFLSTAAPYTQLQGAMGAGWAPGLDVLDAEGGPFNATEQRCLDVHKKQGTDYNSRNEAAAVAMLWCDVAWLFEEAAIKAGKNLNAGNWSAALAELKTSHQSPVTFGTNFGPGIFDGANQYRPLKFDDSASCRCFRYSGPPQDVPR